MKKIFIFKYFIVFLFANTANAIKFSLTGTDIVPPHITAVQRSFTSRLESALSAPRPESALSVTVAESDFEDMFNFDEETELVPPPVLTRPLSAPAPVLTRPLSAPASALSRPISGLQEEKKPVDPKRRMLTDEERKRFFPTPVPEPAKKQRIKEEEEEEEEEDIEQRALVVSLIKQAVTNKKVIIRHHASKRSEEREVTLEEILHVFDGGSLLPFDREKKSYPVVRVIDGWMLQVCVMINERNQLIIKTVFWCGR